MLVGGDKKVEMNMNNLFLSHKTFFRKFKNRSAANRSFNSLLININKIATCSYEIA